MHRFYFSYEFYDLWWVKEIMRQENFLQWEIRDEMILGVYLNEQTGQPEPAWHGVVEKGTLNLNDQETYLKRTRANVGR